MKIGDVPKLHRKTRVGRKILVDEDRITKSLVMESYYDFIKEFWDVVVQTKPVWNWHIEHAANEVQVMYERVFKNQHKEYDLVYNQPPATTKSLVFSVFSLPWAWTRMPSFRQVGCSYSMDPVATDLSRYARSIVKSEKYQRLFPDIVVSREQDTKHYFTNTKGGQRYCTGVMGAVTSKHFHAVVIDDPLSPQEALSDAEVDRTNRWITDTLMSRKVDENVAVVQLVMQRLRQNDPSAMMAGLPNTKQIILPATTEFPIYPPELERFYVDGLLDPHRLSRKTLANKKAGTDEYGYASQYGQQPVPLGGGLFMTKLFKYSTYVPPMLRTYRFWDKANTKNRGAFTVGVKMGVDKYNGYWVLDVVRGRWDTHTREVYIRETARRDGRDVFVGLEQEPGSGAKESNEKTIARLAGFKVKSIAPKGDKEMRAVPFSSQVNAANVTIARDTDNKPFHWEKDYVEELAYFPYSTWKDQVDATSGAFTCLSTVRRRLGAI